MGRSIISNAGDLNILDCQLVKERNNPQRMAGRYGTVGSELAASCAIFGHVSLLRNRIP